MKITVSFINLEHTPSLDERIQEKSQKLAKYLGGKTHVKWSCYIKDNYHYAEIDLVGPSIECHATGKSQTMYKTIDQAINKLERQLNKKKEIFKNRMHRKGADLVILDPEMAWAEYDEDYIEEAA